MHVDHQSLRSFAENQVNLPASTAKEYRNEVKNLRERLEEHIDENPDFALVKMLNAGSVAKGTALRTINDMDVAVYVRNSSAPEKDEDLVPWLADRLREAYPRYGADRFDDTPPHCVTIHLDAIDVDVVPVLVEEGETDEGCLINKNNGDRIKTNVSLHLEFIRERKKKYPEHYAQLIRFVKWWAKQRKMGDSSFKCKSFLIELIVSDLADNGLEMGSYPEALEQVFSYFVKSGLEETIYFNDFIKGKPKETNDPIRIFDPVNFDNNVAGRYSVGDRQRLVNAAEEAADAISEAYYATTKARAVECWQQVFGPSFKG